MSELLGIFGGTFSPPHLGHVRAAEAFLRLVHPDRFLIIPTYIPPHKTASDGATPEDRLMMCRLAFGELPKTLVTDMEIRRQGKSYTSDTLRELAKPGRNLACLIGTDMMLTLDTWHEPETIFRLSDLYCVRREEDPVLRQRMEKKNREYQNSYGKQVHLLVADPLEISSTEIRAAVSRGDPTSCLPQAVSAYIRDRRLYGCGG